VNTPSSLPLSPAMGLAPRPGSSVRAAPAHYDPKDVPPQIREAAEGMEAMFLDYLMKVMRQGVQTSEMSMESPATGIYRSMLDSETAQKAAKTGGTGLSQMIVDYMMSQNGYTGRTAQGSAGEVHGGTYEGQSGRE